MDSNVQPPQQGPFESYEWVLALISLLVVVIGFLGVIMASYGLTKPASPAERNAKPAVIAPATAAGNSAQR